MNVPHVLATTLGLAIVALAMARWLRADFRRVAWIMAQEVSPDGMPRWQAAALMAAAFAIVLYGLAF